MEQPAPPGKSKPRTGGDSLIFLLIFLLALAVRLVFLLEARAVPFFTHLIADSEAYDAWARQIAAGNWLGHEAFYQAPLYPYFLAVVQRFVRHNLFLIRLVQVLLGSVACGFLFLAGRLFFSRAVGIAAGVLLALYPPAIFFDGLIQKSVLDCLGLAVLLWLLGRVQRRPTPALCLGAGAALGLLILTRENALLTAPLLGFWILVRFRDRAWNLRLRWLGAFAGGVALPLTVVGLRNRAVSGEFLPTTYQAGPNFFIGNHAGATGGYVPLRPGRGNTPFERQDATELAEQALGRRLGPREVSRFWFDQAWTYIRAQPADWGRLMARKFGWTVNAYEIPDSEDLYFYAKYSFVLRGLGTVWHFGVLAPLAVAGIVLTWPRRRDLWLLYGLVLVIAASVALFFVFARYRYPLVTPLILFAAAALVEGVRAVAARQGKRVALAAVLTAGAAIGVNAPIDYPKDWQIATSHANAGLVLARQGEGDAALRHFQAAVQIEPRCFEAHYGRGVVLGMMGRVREAREALETGLQLSPSATYIEAALGAVCLKSGDLDNAVRYLKHAVETRPVDTEALCNLSLAWMLARRWEPALACLRQALAAVPDDPVINTKTAWLLAVCPDGSLRDGKTAVELARKACEATAFQEARSLDALAAAYAETDQFAEAVVTAEKALKAAQAAFDRPLAAELQDRLESYRSNRPYRLP